MEFFQARILKWVAIPFSGRSAQPRDQICISCIGRWVLYHWPPRSPKGGQTLTNQSWLLQDHDVSILQGLKDPFLVYWASISLAMSSPHSLNRSCFFFQNQTLQLPSPCLWPKLVPPKISLPSMSRRFNFWHFRVTVNFTVWGSKLWLSAYGSLTTSWLGLASVLV